MEDLLFFMDLQISPVKNHSKIITTLLGGLESEGMDLQVNMDSIKSQSLIHKLIISILLKLYQAL